MLNSWLVMVTSMHVGVLYLNLLAYIYSNEAGDLQKFKWSNLFIGMSWISCVIVRHII